MGFRRFIDLVEWVVVVLLAAMVGVVSVGVFFRYVLDAALVWYDEFASYLLVWLTFTGAVVAASRDRHIGFEMLEERATPRARRAMRIVRECCILGFQVVLVYYGWDLVRKMGDETAVSIEWVRMGWIYAVLPVAGALMLCISLGRLAQLLVAGEGERRHGLAHPGDHHPPDGDQRADRLRPLDHGHPPAALEGDRVA
ncbi:MAG: TRAP transporter small permease [Candidatus Methylomirabilales bacterium]